MARHQWPGNIRELENVLGYACMMVMGEIIDVQDLPEYVRSSNRDQMAHSSSHASEHATLLDGTFEEHEKRLLADAMAANPRRHERFG